MPVVLLIGLLGWAFNIDFVSVPMLCVFAGLVLFFCDDVKNVFIIVFAIPFLPNKIEGQADFIVLGAGVAFFFIAVIFFLVKHLAVKKTSVKKGKLFWGFVASLVAYLLGGVWGYFNPLNALIILVLTCATYFLYWVAINFTTDFRKFINYVFIAIGVLLGFQLLVSYIRVEGPLFSAITQKSVVWIGLQNINVVAIYFMLAMVSTFQLALKNKYDYLLTLAGLIFFVLVYFTYSRMGLLLCVVLMIPCVIYVFIKSSNKKIFLIIAGVGVALVGAGVAVFWSKISQLFSHYLTYGFSGNGRDSLWPWCWQKFIENPIFGIGFKSENVPGVSANTFVLAHNTVLQYLVSVGIVGSLLMLYYFVERYRIIFSNFNEIKLFNLFHVLVIALSGITDQSPACDVFMICMAISLVAIAEIDSAENVKKEKSETTENLKEEKNKDEKVELESGENSLENSQEKVQKKEKTKEQVKGQNF